MQDYDYLFKYILVGHANSGKSLALNSNNHRKDNEPLVGV